MERLTDKHFNKTLGYYMKCSGCCERSIACNECEEFEALVDRLGAIEEILGDGYDLDRLREMVEADRDGRCVVLPAGVHTEKDGENALKSAMNTCFYHNNPVTRYIADAVAEKLTREADKAALKGDQQGKEV